MGKTHWNFHGGDNIEERFIFKEFLWKRLLWFRPSCQFCSQLCVSLSFAQSLRAHHQPAPVLASAWGSPAPWVPGLSFSFFACSLAHWHYHVFLLLKAWLYPPCFFIKLKWWWFTFFSSHCLLVYICQDGTGSPQGTSGIPLAGAGWIMDKQSLHSLTHKGPFISS